MNEFFTRAMSSGSVPSIKGGQQIYNKLLANKSCWDPSAKRTNFVIEPAYYRVCEKKFECLQP